MNRLVLLLTALLSQMAVSQETRMLRNPAISSNHIAFVYAGDIWTADTDGSNATRLTTFPGVEADPAFSPDGKTIAFTAVYDGNMDVYVLPVSGGEPVRLTWHPGPDLVVGWTPDGSKILFTSGRQNVPNPDPNSFWTVPATGGQVEKFIVPRGVTGTFSPDGKRFAYQKILQWESEFRNYRGGQNNPVRLIDLTTLEVEKVPFDNSNDKDPVWLENKVFFLSDRDLAMNVWSYDTHTRQVKQETFFKDFDCKNLEGGGDRLIFENGGFLFTLNAAGGQPVKLPVRINGDFPWMRPHWVKIQPYLSYMSISPTGSRAVLSARGDIFTAPAEKGDVRNLTQSQGIADREPAWSPDGKTIAWFSDESGEYQVVLADQYGKVSKKIRLANPTFFYTPRWSPDSKYLSFADAGRTLYVLDVEKETVQTIDNEGYAHPLRIIYPVWSPDSKWVAYAKRLPNELAAIFVWSADQKKSFPVTDGMSHSHSPVFDRSGKYLYFLSSVNYGLNIGWLDMSSYERPQAFSIYAAVLSKEEANPLAPESDDEKPVADTLKDNKDSKVAKKEKKDGKETKDETGTTGKAVKIDFDGLLDRIIALDLPAKYYTSLEAGEEGVLFFSEGSMTEPVAVVSKYTLKERKPTKLASGITNFVTSADGKK
jgi:tricorn protease